MKKKIVIYVPMHNDKAKSKAMKIAVAIEGVVSVSIGEGNDELVVIGEGVDSVCLANSLRKKFCFANITSIDDDKPAGPEQTISPSPPSPSPPKQIPMQCCAAPSYYPLVYYEHRVYDAPPPDCSIL